MSTAAKPKMLALESSDGEQFEVAEEAMGKASAMIRGIIDEGCDDEPIRLPQVKGPVLARVLEYVNRHFADPNDVLAASFHFPNADDPIKRFDDAFVQVDQETLFDLIDAANYLDIQSLLDLTCMTVADQMKGKSLDEIRKHFHIVNDYSKDEEEDVRRENSWAFE